jgi:sugar fermentation stimulation protein A
VAGVKFSGEVMTGVLERRYKRFFVDVTLDGRGLVTAHTPNTGAMTGLLGPRSPVLVTFDPAPHKKLDYTLQAIRVGRTWVGTNTYLANPVVEHALREGVVRRLGGYRTFRREVKYGRQGRSRVDLLLTDHRRGRVDCHVEVKSVTLREGRRALFPDAVSERGTKHLVDLAEVARGGGRAAMVYLTQRTDCDAFAPADAVDPAYGEALRDARAAGVEVYCLVARTSRDGVRVVGRLPVRTGRRRA